MAQFTQSFLLECTQAIHDFSADTFKVSLHAASAALGSATTAYSTTGEIANGDGYTTAGATAAVSSGYPQIVSSQAAVRFDDVVWTLTAAKTFRYALLYNSSKANRAVMVMDVGRDTAYDGTFTIKFPLTLDAPVRFVTAA